MVALNKTNIAQLKLCIVMEKNLCIILVVAQEHGKGCDPGLEEAAHNDDSAHENTEKC